MTDKLCDDLARDVKHDTRRVWEACYFKGDVPPDVILTEWAHRVQRAESDLVRLAESYNRRAEHLATMREQRNGARREAEVWREHALANANASMNGHEISLPHWKTLNPMSWERKAEGAGPQPNAKHDFPNGEFACACGAWHVAPKSVAPPSADVPCPNAECGKGLGHAGLCDDPVASWMDISPTLATPVLDHAAALRELYESDEKPSVVTREEFDREIARIDRWFAVNNDDHKEFDALRNLVLALANRAIETGVMQRDTSGLVECERADNFLLRDLVHKVKGADR